MGYTPAGPHPKRGAARGERRVVGASGGRCAPASAAAHDPVPHPAPKTAVTGSHCAWRNAREAASLAAKSCAWVEAGLAWRNTPIRMAAQISGPQAGVLVACQGGRLPGFAVMQFGDDAAHLVLLCVDPAARRRGIGGRLIGRLQHHACNTKLATPRLQHHCVARLRDPAPAHRVLAAAARRAGINAQARPGAGHPARSAIRSAAGFEALRAKVLRGRCSFTTVAQTPRTKLRRFAGAARRADNRSIQ